MAKHKSWQCPYCEGYATIGEHDLFTREEKFSDYIDIDLTYILTAIVCPNAKCRKLNLHLRVTDITNIMCSVVGVPISSYQSVSKTKNDERKTDIAWRLLPSSKAKIFPDYIPLTIRQDYEEACKIKDLSPKSSATLARRCLQTIIRDFWNIKNKRNLNEEIDALITNSTINSELIAAFHDLRNIGNLGAHMEKDVNLIIDVEPEEAEELIKFTEVLIGLTYIERYNREQLLSKIKTISAEKKNQKQLATKT